MGGSGGEVVRPSRCVGEGDPRASRMASSSEDPPCTRPDRSRAETWEQSAPAYSPRTAAALQPPASSRSQCSAVPGPKPRSLTVCRDGPRTAHVPTNPGERREVPDSAPGEWSLLRTPRPARTPAARSATTVRSPRRSSGCPASSASSSAFTSAEPTTTRSAKLVTRPLARHWIRLGRLRRGRTDPPPAPAAPVPERPLRGLRRVPVTPINEVA